MKTSVYIAVTLDGFIAREDGSLDWLPGSDDPTEEKQEDYGYGAFMDSVDVLVMGRKTFETVSAFGEWPYGEKRVIVLSRSLKELGKGLPDTVELRDASPAKLCADLEKEGADHPGISECRPAGRADHHPGPGPDRPGHPPLRGAGKRHPTLPLQDPDLPRRLCPEPLRRLVLSFVPVTKSSQLGMV